MQNIVVWYIQRWGVAIVRDISMAVEKDSFVTPVPVEKKLESAVVGFS